MSDLDGYRGVQARLSELVRPDDASVGVAACPGWTVRDVLAHLTGLCEDWVDHRLDDYASDAWTAAQVERYRNQPVAVIIERWEALLAPFAAIGHVDPFGDPARWALGDAVIHEADVREALGAPRLPEDVVDVALKGAIARWRETLGRARAPSLHLRVLDGRDWWLGTPDVPDAVTAETSSYEVLRAVAGRRSREQVRAWGWDGDPEPFLAAGLPYPFRWSSPLGSASEG